VAEDAASAASRFALNREVSSVADMEGIDMNDANIFEVLFAGYVLKREGSLYHSWDVRFVCLCKGNQKRKFAGRLFLLYFMNHTREYGRGRCELETTNGAFCASYDREYYDEGRRSNVFGVGPKTGNRVRLFDVESDEMRTKWMTALAAAGVDSRGLQATPQSHAASLKEGWVNKCPKRGMGIWNRRYIILTPHTCIYSASRGDTHDQGMIMITTKTTVAVSDKRPFCIKVVSDPSAASSTHQGREFIFQTADEPTFKAWIEAWNSVVKKA